MLDRRIVAAICLAPLVGLLNAFALAPFLPLIAAEMGTSVALLGQVPATMQLVATGLGLVAGPLADRYGYRRLLLAGAAAVIVSSAGIAAAGGIAALVVAAVVGALSRAVMQPVSLTVAGTRFAGDARRQAISYVTAAISGAGTVGVPLLTTVALFYGWRGAFDALALLGVAALALLFVALPEGERAGVGEHVRLRQLLAAYRPLLADRSTLGLIASNMLRSTANWSSTTYIAAYLVEAHGLTPQVGGLALAISGAGQMVGGLIGGGKRFGDRPARPLLAAVNSLIGLTIGASMALPIGPPAIFGLILVGSLIGGVGNVASTTLLVTETRAGRGTTLTLNQSGFSLASACGGALGGLLLALWGYHAIGLAIPLLCFASAWLVLASRRRSDAG